VNAETKQQEIVTDKVFAYSRLGEPISNVVRLNQTFIIFPTHFHIYFTSLGDTWDSSLNNTKNEEEVIKITEKVLSEIRFIETNDGYRVEIKGDKEKLMKMGFVHKGFFSCKFSGRGRGKFWGRGHGYGPPPWAWEWEEMAEDETSPPEENET
jgi:hypothetical protein